MNCSLCSAIALTVLIAISGAQIPGVDIEGPFVRVKRNEDGSKTVFEREDNRKTLTKKTYTPDGHVSLSTIYRLDKEGNPLKCEIFDGLGTKLYKTSFGYSKRPGPTFGKLVQELLFDTRVRRTDELTGKEKPVHMFIYSYNADGSANLPVGVTLIKGRTAEEVFGRSVESQAVPDLSDFEDVTPANPAAKPLRR